MIELLVMSMFVDKSHASSKNFFTSLTTLKAMCIIAVVGLVVYAYSFGNGFVGDDDMQILNNPAVHSAANIPNLFLESTFYGGQITASGLYYKPIMSSIFALIYTIAGPHALLFHIFQTLLFIANTILLFLIFRYFFRPILSLCLALIFLVHPINTENAVYVADLQDTLFFFFGSLAFYLDLRLKPSRMKLVWVSLCLLLSLFSKETGILFIAVILGYEYLSRSKSLRLLLVASSVVLGDYLFFRVIVAHLLFQTTNVAVMQVSLGTRWYSLPSILLYYLRNVFVPLDHAELQMGLMTPQTPFIFFIALLCVVAVFGGIIWVGDLIYQKQETYFKRYLFFAMIFAVGLLFHSQIFFPLDYIAADRWFYFPFVGLLGMVGILVQANAKKISAIPLSTKVLAVLIFLGVLSALAIYRSSLFYNNLTLLSHDVQYSRDSAILAGDLGYTLLQDGQNEAAGKYILKAKQLDPNNAVVWSELANYYYLTGQEDSARDAFKKALSLDDKNYQTYQNYAIFLFVYDTPQQAEAIIKAGLGKFPTNGDLWLMEALVEHKLGNTSTAIDAAKRASTYSPGKLTNTTYNRLSQNQSLDIQTYMSGSHKAFTVCPPNCLKPGSQQATADATFTNETMNIVFAYPQDFQATQISPQVVAIHAVQNITNDNSLLIYSTTYSGDLRNAKLPFLIKGKIKTVTQIPLHGFEGYQATYDDGTVILLLGQKNQAIALRIPSNSTDLSQAITDIVNSVKILR